MATASTIQLDVTLQPAYAKEGVSVESSKEVSKLLQENHDKYHMFFNDFGFHNHIAHQMLTMWALSATPEQLRREYDHNTSYQRPSKPPQNLKVDELQDPDKFIKYMGSIKHYNDFLEYFHKEINQSGWQKVVQQHVFARDKRAEAMFVRLYSSVLHPIIHLGFGIEFKQPAIIAEALAQTASTGDEVGESLVPAEKLANERKEAGSKSITQLIREIHADPSNRTVEHLAQVRVTLADLEKRTAEMTNAVTYYTAGAAGRLSQPADINFFWIHAANCSVFFDSFLQQDWLSDEDKVRMVEWKIRLDLLYYISHGKPELSLDGIRSYKPKQPSGWDAIVDRMCALGDDGHASKLIRALISGQRASKPYENDDAFLLKSEDWLQFGHVVIDAKETPDFYWNTNNVEPTPAH